jgi:hypothetical protein
MSLGTWKDVFDEKLAAHNRYPVAALQRAEGP